MWNTKNMQLGPVEANKSQTLSFFYEDSHKIEVSDIHSPCSCTSVEWDSKEQKLIVTYKPKSVPTHIKVQLKQQSYNDLKTITFKVFENGSIKQDSLNILAQVFDNLPEHLNKKL